MQIESIQGLSLRKTRGGSVGGVNRQAPVRPDRQGRALFVRRRGEASGGVRIDAESNIFS